MSALKSLAMAALLGLAAAQQEPENDCLHCVAMDSRAGWLEEFSYCYQLDTCLMDHWNYINRPCQGEGWLRGRNLTLDYCAATRVNCTNNLTFSSDNGDTWTSSLDWFGRYDNYSSQFKLQVGEYCELKIDATQATARVLFENYFPSTGLGILEFPLYDQGDIITFDSGFNTLTLYNGNQKGQVLFTTSFSGAVSTAVAMGFAAASLVTLF